MVLVQPSSRLASQKPVDRPVSCGEGGGAGRGSFSRLEQSLAPAASLPRYCLCPTEHVQKARETHSLEPQASQPGTSIKNTESTSFPHLSLAYTPTHPTNERLIQREGGTHFHTPCLAVLTLSFPVFVWGGGSCQPHPPPQNKTKTTKIRIIS